MPAEGAYKPRFEEEIVLTEDEPVPTLPALIGDALERRRVALEAAERILQSQLPGTASKVHETLSTVVEKLFQATWEVQRLRRVSPEEAASALNTTTTHFERWFSQAVFNRLEQRIGNHYYDAAVLFRRGTKDKGAVLSELRQLPFENQEAKVGIWRRSFFARADVRISALKDKVPTVETFSVPHFKVPGSVIDTKHIKVEDKDAFEQQPISKSLAAPKGAVALSPLPAEKNPASFQGRFAALISSAPEKHLTRALAASDSAAKRNEFELFYDGYNQRIVAINSFIREFQDFRRKYKRLSRKKRAQVQGFFVDNLRPEKTPKVPSSWRDPQETQIDEVLEKMKALRTGLRRPALLKSIDSIRAHVRSLAAGDEHVSEGGKYSDIFREMQIQLMTVYAEAVRARKTKSGKKHTEPALKNTVKAFERAAKTGWVPELPSKVSYKMTFSHIPYVKKVFAYYGIENVLGKPEGTPVWMKRTLDGYMGATANAVIDLLLLRPKGIEAFEDTNRRIFTAKDKKILDYVLHRFFTETHLVDEGTSTYWDPEKVYEVLRHFPRGAVKKALDAIAVDGGKSGRVYDMRGMMKGKAKQRSERIHTERVAVLRAKEAESKRKQELKKQAEEAKKKK